MAYTRTTDNGIRFNTVETFASWWSEYDNEVAESHLQEYGKIIVNEYGCPIDNEYDLEEIEEYL